MLENFVWGIRMKHPVPRNENHKCHIRLSPRWYVELRVDQSATLEIHGWNQHMNIQVLRDFMRPDRPFWMTASGKQMWVGITDRKKRFAEIMCNFVFSTEPSAGLAQLDSTLYAFTVMAQIYDVGHRYMRPGIERLVMRQHHGMQYIPTIIHTARTLMWLVCVGATKLCA